MLATHPLSMNVNVVTLDIVHESLSMNSFNEGNACTLLVRAQIDIEDVATTDERCDVFMYRAFRQIFGNDGSLFVPLIVRPLGSRS